MADLKRGHGGKPWNSSSVRDPDSDGPSSVTGVRRRGQTPGQLTGLAERLAARGAAWTQSRA